jgi:alginate O-acetyltransferase complex protein AlgI
VVCFSYVGFVAWCIMEFCSVGAFHGVFLILEKLFILKLFKKMGVAGSFVSLIYCFFVVMMGWVLFFIEDLGSVGIFYNKLFAFDFTVVNSPFSNEFFFILCMAISFSFCTLLKPFQKMHDFVFSGEYNSRQLIIMFIITICLFIFSVSSISATDFNPFIYFRF